LRLKFQAFRKRKPPEIFLTNGRQKGNMDSAGLKRILVSWKAPFLGPAGKFRMIQRGEMRPAQLVKCAIRANNPALRELATAYVTGSPELTKVEVLRHRAGAFKLRNLLVKTETTVTEMGRTLQLLESIRRTEEVKCRSAVVKNAVAEHNDGAGRKEAIALIMREPATYVDLVALYLDSRLAKTVGDQRLYPERMRAKAVLEQMQWTDPARISQLLIDAPPEIEPIV
jgi:hypothetical protein